MSGTSHGRSSRPTRRWSGSPDRIPIARRFPTSILVWPVPVQGEGAAERIAAAIAGFDAMPSGAFSTNLAWNQAIARGRLFGTALDGVWLHVGTPQARDEAEAYLTGAA